MICSPLQTAEQLRLPLDPSLAHPPLARASSAAAAPQSAQPAAATDAARGVSALDSYYAPAAGRDGVDLLRALHNVISEGTTDRDYEEARHFMFERVDDPTGKNVVVDLYTGRKVSGVAGLDSATNKGLTAEHTWPQSKGATQRAKGDLHCLFPVDGEVNTMRSNLPYGEVAAAKWASPAQAGVDELSLIGTDESGRKVFEPRASMRGDIARAQLYFFTRYFGDKPKRFQLDDFATSLTTLLQWHKLDPPSDAERARNDAIALVQGNRNPFVDHPDYVGRIGFDAEMLRRKPQPRSKVIG